MTVQQQSRLALDPFGGVPHATGLYTGLGFGLIGALVLGFGIWAGTAPMAGAVVASGSFVSGGDNKAVQSLEGGIVTEIAVHEGDIVAPGQLLMRLDDTAPRAELRRLLLRRDRLTAIAARLTAEMRDEDDAVFPAATGQAERDRLADDERQTFVARRRALDSDVRVLQSDVEALKEKRNGTVQQRNAVTEQLALLRQEFDAKSFLLSSGDIRKSDVLSLQRAMASAQGEIGRLEGDTGDVNDRIARTEGQIVSLHTAAIRAAAEQLNAVRAELGDVQERISEADALVRRTSILAPVCGTVMKLRYPTVGGVVEAGKSIMDIVPTSEDLLLEARVRSQDIANLHPGQQASVRLTALNARVTPMVEASLVYVSADVEPDERWTPASAGDRYRVRLRLTDEAKRLKGFTPQAGMPAEIFIATGERTFLEYLLKPLRDSLQRAFRET